MLASSTAGILLAVGEAACVSAFISTLNTMTDGDIPLLEEVSEAISALDCVRVNIFFVHHFFR